MHNCLRWNKNYLSRPGHSEFVMQEIVFFFLYNVEIFIYITDDYSAKVTPLGYTIAAFPVSPRYGKMLALSKQHDLLQYTVCLVAALSVQEVLIESNPKIGSTKSHWNQTRRSWAGTGNSLLLGLFLFSSKTNEKRKEIFTKTF